MFIFEKQEDFLDKWGHSISMVVLTLLMCLLCFYYSRVMRKIKYGYSEMSRVVFMMFTAIQWIKKLTYQILGKSYRIAVPFFVYIISVLWFSNIISILGFKSIGSSLVVPATLAAVVFFGTLISGIVHRGRSFFGDYFVWIKYRKRRIFPLLDPLKLVGEISKLLSLTFRLWGNTLAGSLILFVIYRFSIDNLFSRHDYLAPVLVPLFVFPLHIYFDIIDGTIQPMIFMMLTMCYWAIARHGESSPVHIGYDIESKKVVENHHG